MQNGFYLFRLFLKNTLGGHYMSSEWDVIEKNLEKKIALSDRWYRLILHMIKESEIDITENTSILEVGCGVGAFCIWAAKNCGDVFGLDISRLRIRTANYFKKSLNKKSHKRKINFIVGDAQLLPFKDCSFDITVCAETLEHVPNDIKAFNELVRVTKKMGYVIITVPNFVNMTCLYRIFPLVAFWRTQPDALHVYDTFKLNEFFKRKDLRIIAKKGIGLIGIRSSKSKLKGIEHLFDTPQSKLMPLCINIGIIAQKIV